LDIVHNIGKEFCNEIVDTLLQRMKIYKMNITPYYLQRNAQAEVCNIIIAAFLKIQLLSSTLDCEQYIAPMMFAYNTSYHRSIKATPFKVRF
jgi:hypothetical protein